MRFVLAVLAAAVLFGTTGTSQALGPDGTTPFAVGVVRLLVGGTVLAIATTIAARLRRRRSPEAPRQALTARPLVLMGLTAVCLFVYQPLFFLGTSANGVAVSTVIALGSAPVLAGLLEWALTRRGPGALWLAATALSTLGVALLGLGGAAGGSADPVGLVASVGAGASFAVIAVAQRRLLEAGWHPLTVVGAMGGGSAAIALGALPFADVRWVVEPRGALMALWLGLATITAAYALFTWGLGGLKAATAATLTLGEPLTASLLGIAVLGERLAPLSTVGLVVLGAGLLLLAWGSRSARDAPAEPGSRSARDDPAEPGSRSAREADDPKPFAVEG
ncbi:DMT family transporter [Microbacterium marinilacus]|uniref:Carboxylate/amino acid/amine transporter n=1 Tax=Microbacterium marinilacus TaxID=415209 RepID=A0ABP7BFN1_9MICO|nr:EamA family transporter [Microbacterium marinilacus]MBY0688972.1 DMT family transporter [Microbacterium marinilacus]